MFIVGHNLSQTFLYKFSKEPRPFNYLLIILQVNMSVPNTKHSRSTNKVCKNSTVITRRYPMFKRIGFFFVEIKKVGRCWSIIFPIPEKIFVNA